MAIDIKTIGGFSRLLTLGLIGSVKVGLSCSFGENNCHVASFDLLIRLRWNNEVDD